MGNDELKKRFREQEQPHDLSPQPLDLRLSTIIYYTEDGQMQIDVRLENKIVWF